MQDTPKKKRRRSYRRSKTDKREFSTSQTSSKLLENREKRLNKIVEEATESVKDSFIINQEKPQIMQNDNLENTIDPVDTSNINNTEIVNTLGTNENVALPTDKDEIVETSTIGNTYTIGSSTIPATNEQSVEYKMDDVQDAPVPVNASLSTTSQSLSETIKDDNDDDNNKNINPFKIVDSSLITVSFLPIHPDARIPKKVLANDVCYDVYAVSRTITGDYVEYGLGFKTAFPITHEGQIRPRSGNSNYDLILCNSIGTVEAQYRGEWKVRFKIVRQEPSSFLGKLFFGLKKLFTSPKLYEIGDRVAQVTFKPIENVQWVNVIDSNVNELDDTDRGTRGFHSTGVK